MDSPFTIRVLDWDADGAHDVIGSMKTTLREWSFGAYRQSLKEPGREHLSEGKGSPAFSTSTGFVRLP